MGWNAMREQIFTNQKRLGVIPANAKLTERPDSLPKWATLSPKEKTIFARQPEVYPGHTAYTDNKIGRAIQQVEDMGNATAPTRHHTQYFEMISNRGIYQDGWYANTTPPHGPWILNAPMPAPGDYKWELYNLNNDYSQADDLAAKMPDKLKQMQKL